MRRILATALLVSCATTPPAPPTATPPVVDPTPRIWQPRAVVLRHGRVMPASGPAIADGAIAFERGVIVAVGPNGAVATPAGAEEIDVTGRFVTPGIIDVHSHLGVYASPSTVANDDGNEATAPVTAEVSAEHGFWPQDPGLRQAVAGGVTSQIILPGSANLIGGRGFPIKLHFGRSAAEMRFPGAKDSLKMACGENPKRVYGGGKKTAPSTRMGNVAGYRQAFAQARDYQAKWTEWEEKRKKDAKTAGPPPGRDLKLETLAATMRGELLVQNHCYRADEMGVMLGIAREFGYHIRAFHHALEAYKVRDLLAGEEVAIATWADWWGFKLEAWDGIPENAGLQTEAGGRAVIHSDSPVGGQRLNQEAAKALAAARAAGIALTEEQALRWITLNAAWVMGVEARTGSLEPGKMADVVVWDHHPFSVYARAERVYVDGALSYDAAHGAAVPSDFELTGKPDTHPIRPTGAPASTERAGAAAPIALPTGASPGCAIIRGARVLGRPSGDTGGDVVLRGKTIVGRGQGEGDCRVVDARGAVLTPGLIDAYTQLGLIEVSLEDNARDSGPTGREAERIVHASLRAADSFNPSSQLLPVARQGGITSALVLPTGGLVSGLVAVASTAGELRRPELALAVHLGEGGQQALHSTRGAALETFADLLEDALTYAHRRPDFEQNRMRPLGASHRDLEALDRVREGALPAIVDVDRAVDIRAALKLAREKRLRIVVAGGAEAWQLAEELAAAKVPVIVHPTENLPGSFDRLGARLDNAALLAKAGVKVLISSMQEPHMVRVLRQEAGNAVAWGLPYDEGLRAVTSNVADVFGLDAGRIQNGATADLVLWSGDPLELDARPLAMWVSGRQVALESRQGKLLEKYRSVPTYPIDRRR